MINRDDPICSHKLSEVMVTNQPEEFDGLRSHRSAWVCIKPSCVLDAMAWVMRGTGEEAWYKVGVDGKWKNDIPKELS